MSKLSYSDLLRDPRWQRRRLEILNRAEFKCEECEDSTSTLHVHHKKYRKGAMPWEYSDAELQALCESCHSAGHQLREALDTALAELPLWILEQIVGYAESEVAIIHANFCSDNVDLVHVRSPPHAEGIMDALWMWNSGRSRPDPCCLCDHGKIDTDLLAALGEGEMPHPIRR